MTVWGWIVIGWVGGSIAALGFALLWDWWMLRGVRRLENLYRLPSRDHSVV